MTDMTATEIAAAVDRNVNLSTRKASQMTTQKLWTDMTPAQREAFRQTPEYHDPTNPARVPWGKWSHDAQDKCLGAIYRGERVDLWCLGARKETKKSWPPSYETYRIPPEPKRETVRITGYCDGDNTFFAKAICEEDTHAITFDTIDGKPVLTKCPHCGTAPVDMEDLG